MEIPIERIWMAQKMMIKRCKAPASGSVVEVLAEVFNVALVDMSLGKNRGAWSYQGCPNLNAGHVQR